MTPKEKAKDLYVRFSDYCSWDTFEEEQDYINNIKQCALIAVEEIIEATSMYQYGINNALEHIPAKIVKHPYWQEVKKEIEAL